VKNTKEKKQAIKTKFQQNLLLIRRRLLRLFQQGLYVSQAAKQLNISKQLCLYYTKGLTRQGYLNRDYKSAYANYSLTPKALRFLSKVKDFSLPMSHINTRLHNISIEYPILQDNPKATWDKDTQLRNWIAHYDYCDLPIDVTIKKTPGKIIAYYKQFSTSAASFLPEFFKWQRKSEYYLKLYLQKEKGILIDEVNGEFLHHHIATDAQQYEGVLDKRSSVEVDLGRPAVSILPVKEQNAKAWYDRSLGKVEIETNDLLYNEKLVRMPEEVFKISGSIADFTQAVDALTKQINLHLEVQRESLKTQIQTGKTLEELNKAIKELRRV
jgi:predicted transcriptional regulator